MPNHDFSNRVNREPITPFDWVENPEHNHILTRYILLECFSSCDVRKLPNCALFFKWLSPISFKRFEISKPLTHHRIYFNMLNPILALFFAKVFNQLVYEGINSCLLSRTVEERDSNSFKQGGTRKHPFFAIQSDLVLATSWVACNFHATSLIRRTFCFRLTNFEERSPS